MSKPWSAKRARAGWERNFPIAHLHDMRHVERHLARAYLAGWEAARRFLEAGGHDLAEHLLVNEAFRERARLTGEGRRFLERIAKADERAARP